MTGDQEPTTVTTVTLQHVWSGLPVPLHGMTLEVCYRLRSDGAVTRQLVGVLDLLGEPVGSPRRSLPGLNWREEQERGGVQGNGRPVVLVADQDGEAALLTWLESVGLLAEGES